MRTTPLLLYCHMHYAVELFGCSLQSARRSRGFPKVGPSCTHTEGSRAHTERTRAHTLTGSSCAHSSNDGDEVRMMSSRWVCGAAWLTVSRLEQAEVITESSGSFSDHSSQVYLFLLMIRVNIVYTQKQNSSRSSQISNFKISKLPLCLCFNPLQGTY